MIYNLVVGGTWEYDPGVLSGDIPPTSSVIEGKRIFGCSIEASQTEIAGNQEDMIDIRFRLDNRGNCENTYTLCVRNEKNLMLKDIDPSFPMAQVTFCHEENMSLNLSVKIGQSTPLDSFVIEVEMTSKGAQEDGYNETVSSTCNVVLNVVNEREEEETTGGDQDEGGGDAEDDESNGETKEENDQDANGDEDRNTGNLQDVDETPFIGLVPLVVSISLAAITIGKRRRFRFRESRNQAD